MKTKTISLAPKDIETLQRILDGLCDREAHPESDREEAPSDRLANFARVMLAARKRRSDFLQRSMLGEPAYDMLLGLYVAEADGQALTATGLADLAGVAQSSALRWIEYLVTKELIVREPNPHHKRAPLLKLSCKGRAALDGVFQAIFESFEEVRA